MVGERRRFRATLAYDGTAYQGFQRQAGGAPTIQGEVEAAIARITGQVVTVIGAGRTDTGVHATGQVIAFDLVWPHEAVQLMNAINAHLPPDIALQDIAQHEGFHPRFDALTRLYSYYILPVRQRFPMHRSRTWQLRAPLDAAAMQAAAALLVGRHDFAALARRPAVKTRCERSYDRAGKRLSIGMVRRACWSIASKPMPFLSTWCGALSARWLMWGWGAARSMHWRRASPGQS